MKRLALIMLIAPYLAWVASSAQASTTQGVKLFWTHGVCRNCQTARTIADVQFVSPREAWGIGYAPPGGFMGLGDYAILHSRDGGQRWTELPNTYVHNESPSLSFASRKQGLMMIDDIVNADTRLLQTRDGGGHWRRLAPSDLTLRGLQDLGGGVSYAYETDYNSQSSYVAETNDFGRTWRNFPMPAGFSADHMAFSDRAHGLIAGCLHDKIAALRTADGGLRWNVISLDLPRIDAREGFCGLEVDDLTLRTDGKGVILVSKHSFSNGDRSDFVEALRTADGGSTWSEFFRRSQSIPVVTRSEPGVTGYEAVFPVYTTAQFVGRNSTLITKNDGLLMISDDNGKQWREMHLPHPVKACRPFGPDLTCAAGESDEFWVLRISANP